MTFVLFLFICLVCFLPVILLVRFAITFFSTPSSNVCPLKDDEDDGGCDW